MKITAKSKTYLPLNLLHLNGSGLKDESWVWGLNTKRKVLNGGACFPKHGKEQMEVLGLPFFKYCV